MSLAAILLTLGLLAAAAYLPRAGRPGGIGTGILKTAPALAFAAASLAAEGQAFLTAALVCSAAGDFALSRPGRAAFLYGLSAFAVAHILLILAFQMLSPAPLWEAFAAAPPLAIGLVLLALSTELWLAPHAGAQAWPVRGYVVLIAAMGLAALLLPPQLWPVKLGAGLFIASDLILAVRLFRMPDTAALAQPASRALWALYVAGQALIVTGITGA